jgi:hypothetical protein
MKQTCLKLIGVYKPQISSETWQEQWRVTADDKQTGEHFEKLVLIEGVVDGLNDLFDMAKFGQMQAEHPNDPKWMQVGYDEGLLSADGEMLIQREMNCVQGTGPLRFAVYLHLFDPMQTLQWQGGEVTCPTVQDAPIRLMMLMPYNACS